MQISYSAHLINAKLVDTATSDLPAVMVVSNAVRGLNEALQLMQAGDHWELVIPSDLAFGGKGTPDGGVPPNQTLVFDITLMAVTPAQTAQGQVGTRNCVCVWPRPPASAMKPVRCSRYRNNDTANALTAFGGKTC